MPTMTTHRPHEEQRDDKDVQHQCEIIVLYPNRQELRDAFKDKIDAKVAGEPETFKRERDHLSSEMIFLKDRDSSLNKSSARMEACDLLAADMFPLEKILNATTPEENEKLYDEASILRTIYVNQLITCDHIDGETFEEQRGLARIELIRFLLQKTRLCYDKGILLKEKNLDDLFLKHTELRLDKIQNDIRQLLKEAFAIGAHDPESLEAFKSKVAALTTETKEPEIPLPEKAPALYAERPDRSEKPEAFLERTYEGLTGTADRPASIFRSHIKAWDSQLYDALYKRRKIIENFEALLPKSQGKSVADLGVTDEEFLERHRKRDAARKRHSRP